MKWFVLFFCLVRVCSNWFCCCCCFVFFFFFFFFYFHCSCRVLKYDSASWDHLRKAREFKSGVPPLQKLRTPWWEHRTIKRTVFLSLYWSEYSFVCCRPAYMVFTYLVSAVPAHSTSLPKVSPILNRLCVFSSELKNILVVGIHFVSPWHDPSRLSGRKSSSIYLSMFFSYHWSPVSKKTQSKHTVLLSKWLTKKTSSLSGEVVGGGSRRENSSPSIFHGCNLHACLLGLWRPMAVVAHALSCPFLFVMTAVRVRSPQSLRRCYREGHRVNGAVRHKAASVLPARKKAISIYSRRCRKSSHRGRGGGRGGGRTGGGGEARYEYQSCRVWSLDSSVFSGPRFYESGRGCEIRASWLVSIVPV